MQKITVIGPNLPRGAKAEFHVHADGCADIRRGRITRDAASWVMAAETFEDVVDAVYPPEDFDCEPGEYIGEFYFAPCVALVSR